MTKKNKIIKPRFFYDKNNNPTDVYLSIDDYNAFMERLKKFSNEAQQQNSTKKKTMQKAKTLK